MLAAAALGALSAVDRTAFAQTMLSHPVVCGGLAGWIAGDPVSGLRLGIVYGMFASRRAPIGGGGPVIDWSSAAVAVPFALGPSAAGWQWGLGLAAGVLVALLGGHMIRFVRRLAASNETALDEAARDADLGRIERFHLGFVGLHLVRGALVTFLAAFAISSMAFDFRWSGPEQSAAAMIWGFSPLVAAVFLLDAHRRHAGWRPVTLGISAAAAVLLWVGVIA